MVEILRNIELKAGVGGRKDDSDNLDNMNKYEKFILDIDMLKTLMGFDIVHKEGTELKGDSMIIDPVEDLGYTGATVGGACHELNRIFVAAKLPFYARPYMRNGKWIKSTVQETGAEVDKKVAELVRVNRISDEFDPKNYACVAAQRPRKDGSGIVDHEEPTEGQKKRAPKWFELYRDELIEAEIIEPDTDENGDDEQ